MGTGNSNLVEPNGDGGDFQNAAELNIEPCLNDYPEPCPPIKRKKTFYEPELFLHIDKRAAMIPLQYSYSYEILLESLITGLTTDLEKVRAIFIWVGSQRIKYLEDVMSDIKTPIGYMLYMKNGSGTYAEFFAHLCRFIDIPCVIVRGIAKGARYEVGDEDLYDCRSVWNCVFIDGEWRIIHCHWAFTGLVGYNHGRWTTLEAESRGMVDHQKPSGGYQVFGIDEFYFLTDPDEFCYFCLPNEEMKRWQLLENPWTYQKFVSMPFLHESFFLYEMNLMFPEKGVIKAPDGQAEIRFKNNLDSEMLFSYRLYYDERLPCKSTQDTLRLKSYSYIYTDRHKVSFVARLPITGIYKLSIRAGWTRQEIVAEFQIHCTSPFPNCLPLPKNPTSGFGYNLRTKTNGLILPSVYQGVVLTPKNLEKIFQFTISPGISVNSVLYHRFYNHQKLQDCVSTTASADNKVTIKVVIPMEVADDRLVLEINARDKKRSRPYRNVCNYLIQPKTEQKTVNVPSQGQAIDVYNRTVQQGLISEIVNYRRPIRIIHDIMKATFILLGEEVEKLEDWDYITTQMRTTGKNGVIRRIKQFVVEETTYDQLQLAHALIYQYDLEMAKNATLGIAAFYIWCYNVIMKEFA